MLATALLADHGTLRPVACAPSSRPIFADPLAQRLATAPVRTVEAKEHIFRDGDEATQVYLVEAGNVCLYRTMADGRRQVMDFAYPGDVIGLGALVTHTASAQATSRTRLRCMTVAALHANARTDARLGVMLYEAMSRELAATRELLFTVSQRTAIERVAGFLVALSRRNECQGEDPLEFVLPMTRGDIADFLGLTIETVSRTFTKLRIDGLIDLSQCVLVTIVDREALAQLADGQ